MSDSSKRVLFTSQEKELLLQFVEQFKKIVENKQTNKVSVQEKLEAWDELSKQFNAVNNGPKRTAKQLKECYRNIKKRATKAVAAQKTSVKKTGGGNAVDDPSPLFSRVAAMNVLAVPLYTSMDSDANQHALLDESTIDVDFPSSLINDSQTTEFLMDVESHQPFGESSIADVTPQPEVLCSDASTQHLTEKSASIQQPGTSSADQQTDTPTRSTVPTQASSRPSALRFFRQRTRKPPAPSATARAAEAISKECSTNTQAMERAAAMAEEKHKIEKRLLEEQLNTELLKQKILEQQLKFFQSLNTSIAENPITIQLPSTNI